MQWSFWNIAGKIGQFFQESHCKFLGQSFAGLGLHDIHFQYIAPFFRTLSHYATTPLISQISWLPAFFGIYIWFSLPLPTSFNQLDLQTLPLPTPPSPSLVPATLISSQLTTGSLGQISNKLLPLFPLPNPNQIMMQHHNSLPLTLTGSLMALVITDPQVI